MLLALVLALVRRLEFRHQAVLIFLSDVHRDQFEAHSEGSLRLLANQM